MVNIYDYTIKNLQLPLKQSVVYGDILEADGTYHGVDILAWLSIQKEFYNLHYAQLYYQKGRLCIHLVLSLK